MIGRVFELTVLVIVLAVALGVHLAAKKAGYDVLAALRRISDRVVDWVLRVIQRADR
jgi:hypothetical protein